ncbi:MAG: hypothetical protein M3Y86_08985 [Verrucomicrobiota bacterium]|nr:hypothetical protein [Verrucomicrobiota bacterium]
MQILRLTSGRAMIETSNPEIDVAELMQRVRAEAARIAERAAGPSRNGQPAAPVLPAIRMLPPPPAPVTIRHVNLKRERLDDLLRRARDESEVARWIPKFLRGIFRQQGEVNRHLLEAVSSLVKTNSELTNRIRDLGGAAEAQSRWLNVLADRRAADNSWMRAVERSFGFKSARPAHEEPAETLQRLAEDVAHLRNDLSALRVAAADPEQVLASIRQVEQLGLQMNQLQLAVEKSASEARLAQRAFEQMTATRSSLEQRLLRLEERAIAPPNER